jgi:hypothetical protein
MSFGCYLDFFQLQWFKFFHIVLETACLHMLNRNFRDINLFYLDFKRRNCPSARGASAANAINTVSNYGFVRRRKFY